MKGRLKGIKGKGLVLIFIRTEISILVIGKIIIRKEMGSFILLMKVKVGEIFIVDNFNRENFKGLGIIFIRNLENNMLVC